MFHTIVLSASLFLAAVATGKVDETQLTDPFHRLNELNFCYGVQYYFAKYSGDDFNPYIPFFLQTSRDIDEEIDYLLSIGVINVNEQHNIETSNDAIGKSGFNWVDKRWSNNANDVKELSEKLTYCWGLLTPDDPNDGDA